MTGRRLSSECFCKLSRAHLERSGDGVVVGVFCVTMQRMGGRV